MAEVIPIQQHPDFDRGKRLAELSEQISDLQRKIDLVNNQALGTKLISQREELIRKQHELEQEEINSFGKSSSK